MEAATATATQLPQTAGTLDEEIESIINLGYKDPYEVYSQLLVRFTEPELADLCLPYMQQMIVRKASRFLRRTFARSLDQLGSDTTKPNDIMLQKLWVPAPDGPSGSVSYKRIADMTAEDFDARAEYLEHQAQGTLRDAQWCRDVASAIRSENVHVARELTSLPEPPNIS